MTKVAGVDGCRAGWLAIFSNPKGKQLTCGVFSSLKDLIDGENPDLVAIDIPIGLTDTGPRECDMACRRILKGRSSCVFPAPIRPALEAIDRASADAISRSVQGKGVPAQAFGIYPRIRDVDEFLRSNPEQAPKVFEIHPELSFWAWNGEQGMLQPKKSAPGFIHRSALVESVFGENAYSLVRGRYPRSRVSDDDILDAYAALWTALRIAGGTSKTCPAEVPRDGAGLPMAMWY